jgi:surfeit locus 1 family protein
MNGPPEHSPKARARFPWGTLFCGGLALLALIGLGTWQVQRLHWKEGLIAKIQERIHAEPLPLDDVERLYGRTGDIEYIRVSATGEFMHEAERHFFATWQGASGYFVYTPFRIADGRVVFVNRGFVPFDKKDPATRQQGQVTGAQTVTGLARLPLTEKPSFVVPDNDPDKNIFYWKDIRAMAILSGLNVDRDVVPFFIDADARPNPGGLPHGGVTIIDLPNNHLQYAITWYGLAVALAGVLGAWFWRWRVTFRSTNSG